jgi:hypothetical protein
VLKGLAVLKDFVGPPTRGAPKLEGKGKRPEARRSAELAETKLHAQDKAKEAANLTVHPMNDSGRRDLIARATAETAAHSVAPVKVALVCKATTGFPAWGTREASAAVAVVDHMAEVEEDEPHD